MAQKKFYPLPKYKRRPMKETQLACPNCIKDKYCHRNRLGSHVKCFSAKPVSKYERIKEMDKEEFAIFLEGFAKMRFEPDREKIASWLDEKYMDIGKEVKGERFDEEMMYGNKSEESEVI